MFSTQHVRARAHARARACVCVGVCVCVCVCVCLLHNVLLSAKAQRLLLAMLSSGLSAELPL